MLASMLKKPLAISLVGIAACLLGSKAANAAESYTYNLPEFEAIVVYPNNGWLPEQYHNNTIKI